MWRSFLVHLELAIAPKGEENYMRTAAVEFETFPRQNQIHECGSRLASSNIPDK